MCARDFASNVAPSVGHFSAPTASRPLPDLRQIVATPGLDFDYLHRAEGWDESATALERGVNSFVSAISPHPMSLHRGCDRADTGGNPQRIACGRSSKAASRQFASVENARESGVAVLPNEVVAPASGEQIDLFKRAAERMIVAVDALAALRTVAL